MSGINPETEGSAWTEANLKKLLAAMKARIPKQERHCSYIKGMKDLVWKKVAFPPFSPKECQEKWLQMLKRMRKVRTLTELITEAEEVLASSPEILKKYQKSRRPRRRNKKRKRVSEDTPDDELSSEDEEGLPSKPPVNGYSLFCKERLAFMNDISKSAGLSECGKHWRGFTEDQRGDYNKRCSDLHKQYLKDLNKYLKTFNKKKRERILNKHRIKISTIKTKTMKRFPGEPKKPPRSSNLIFFKEQMELLKEEIPNAKKRFIQTSQMWKDLSDTEKRSYREKVLKNNSKYMVELQSWFKALKPAEMDDYLKSNPSKLRYLDCIPLPSVKKKSSRRPSKLQHVDSIPLPRVEKKSSRRPSETAVIEAKHRSLQTNRPPFGKNRNVTLQNWNLVEGERCLAQIMASFCLKSVSDSKDSEDEDIEDSSSDEELSESNCEESEEEEEEEEEEDDISFNMF